MDANNNFFNLYLYMKHIIIFVTLLFLSHQICTSELYFPQGMEWKIKVEELCDEKPSYTIQNIRVGKDTVIDNLSYTMIDDIPVRENGSKIYCYVKDWTDNYVEHLLYDFNLKTGDSIVNKLSQDVWISRVTTIDTVILSDGRQARRLQYDNRDTDIEFIGNIVYGFFQALYPVVLPCGSKKFLCCSVNKEPLYEAYPNACKDINNSHTHAYHPMLTEDKTWSYLYDEVSGNATNQLILTTRTYTVLGDTSIWYLNHTYKYLSNYPHWLFREDAEKQKVYTVSFNDGICDCVDCYGCNGVEVVLYDFSAEKGDTLDVFVGHPFAYSYFFKYVVKDVYYKAITPDGEMLKHIELTPTEIPDKWYWEEPLSREIMWIEGIGNNTFELIPETDNYGLLMCVSEGDNLIYSTDLGSQYECYVDTVIDHTALDMIEGMNLNLVVTENLITVDSNVEINSLSVYDLQSRELLKSDLPNIDISPLSSGLYLVTVQTDKGLWSEKFVVK